MELNDAYRELEAKAREAQGKKRELEHWLYRAVEQRNPRLEVRLAKTKESILSAGYFRLILFLKRN